jgi:hypothetical protein
MKMMAETSQISTHNLGLSEAEPENVHNVMHETQTVKTPAAVEVE